MQKVSDNYKKYIKENLALSPKSKIIVDGVEYLGDVIKTSPKFSHSNKTFIGGFPTKTVDFEIYDFDNNIDFEDKEIEIYKGYVIDGAIEYIKQGVFIPRADDIETNITNKTIVFKKVEDKTQLLQDVYETNLDWSTEHTGLEIVLEICDKKGIELETKNFNFADYLFKQPNFPSNTTNREVISRIAEIGGEIAIFNNNGNLVIKGQTPTNDIIERKRYKKLSKEKKYNPNLLVIGNEGYDNDIMFPNIKPDKPIEIKIEDNPFIDLYREEMIEDVANNILKLSYIPFELTDFVDGFYYELNDVITIIDKNGEQFDAVILDISTSSRIKSNIKAPVKEKSLSNYNLAGSNKKTLNEVKFQVNHINNEITALVKETSQYDERISQIEQTADEIFQTVNGIFDFTRDIESIYQLNLENAQEGPLIELHILGEIEFLYPSDTLYPSNDLYPLEEEIYLIIEDSEGNKNKIFLPINYLYKIEDISDEFIIERVLNEETKEYEFKAKVIRRIIVDEDGNKGVASNEQIEDLGFLEIPISKGNNTIYLEYFYDLPILYKAKYAIVNKIFDGYATKAEMNSAIKQTTDEINLETTKKVTNATKTEELIAKINMKPGNILLEGTVTANENFKILKDGSIEANNGSFSGNIFLSNGSKVIGGDGLLTLIQDVKENQFVGFDCDPYMYERFSKFNINLYCYIPKNFKIEYAYVTLIHTPINWSQVGIENYADVKGYAHNIGLTYANAGGLTISATYNGYVSKQELITGTNISNPFNNGNYTASSTSYSETITSRNIKSSLNIGENYIIVSCLDNMPNGISDATIREAASKTCNITAILNVYGYMSVDNK